MNPNTAGPVIGIGEILWDMLPGGKQLGGTVMNVAYHVHQLGERAEIVSCVGDDELGAEARELLRRVGLGDRYVATDPDRPTGTVDVTLGPGGQPRYAIREQVAWDGVPLTPALLELASGCGAVCFGTLAQRSDGSRATVRALVDAAPPGAIRVFDMNLRHQFFDRDVIEWSLMAAHMVKLNHDELDVVRSLLNLPPGDDAAAHALHARYHLNLVALTRGDRGSVVWDDRGERHEHGGVPAIVRDTIGAGDAFTAGFIVGWLRRLPLAQIHDAAAQVAAYVCTQAGGTPPLPDELRRLFVA